MFSNSYQTLEPQDTANFQEHFPIVIMFCKVLIIKYKLTLQVNQRGDTLLWLNILLKQLYSICLYDIAFFTSYATKILTCRESKF